MPIDYNEYPANWRILSIKRRREAGHVCQKCGARDREKHPSKGFLVYLALCHVYDWDPCNVEEWNTAIWCPSCHLKHDNSERGRRRRYGVKYRDQPDLFFGDVPYIVIVRTITQQI